MQFIEKVSVTVIIALSSNAFCPKFVPKLENNVARCGTTAAVCKFSQQLGYTTQVRVSTVHSMKKVYVDKLNNERWRWTSGKK